LKWVIDHNSARIDADWIYTGRIIDTSQWTVVLKATGIWTFARLALDVRLFLKQLFMRSTTPSQDMQGEDVYINSSIEALASAVLEQPPSSSSIKLMEALLTGIKPMIAEQVM